MSTAAQTVLETRPGPGGSPRERVQWSVDGATITVTYGRPSVKGRRIFGSLVPYEQVWRTGADEATTIETSAPLKLESLEVPAGTYTLYTVPGTRRWTLIISKMTGQWGAVYREDADLGRVVMRAQRLTRRVEQFTISVQQAADGAALRLEWENARATAPFTIAP